jgi:hypothetical protein
MQLFSNNTQKTKLIFVLFSGKNERQEPARASLVGCDEGLGVAIGREDQGDPQDLAPHHGPEMGSLSQCLHSRLWRLPGSILLCSGVNFI